MSFNASFTVNLPILFPIKVPVVTALWTPSSEEQLHREYAIIDTNRYIDIINHVKEYLKDKNVKLNVTLVVAARWSNNSSNPEV